MGCQDNLLLWRRQLLGLSTVEQSVSLVGIPGDTSDPRGLSTMDMQFVTVQVCVRLPMMRRKYVPHQTIVCGVLGLFLRTKKVKVIKRSTYFIPLGILVPDMVCVLSSGSFSSHCRFSKELETAKTSVLAQSLPFLVYPEILIFYKSESKCRLFSFCLLLVL